MKPLLLMTSLVTLVCAFTSGCGDDSSEGTGGTGGGAGPGGGGEGGAGTTSSTGSGATTAESVTEARCATASTDAATPLDGDADPPVAMQPETLYEMELHAVPEPDQMVGSAVVEIPEAGRYVLLALDLSGDVTTGAAFIRSLDGTPETEGVECDGCVTACDEVESAFVYDLAAVTYEVGVMGQDQPSVRLLIARVD